MRDQTFRFRCTLRCHLANGEEAMLRGYEVAVQAGSVAEARDVLEAVATEQVHDEGSRRLDAPLDHLEVVSATL